MAPQREGPADDHESEAPEPDGRQLRWEAHNQARRQRLLDAAISLLEEREVGADLRMAEIAERAGLRRTVIYRYFTDKDELRMAVEYETGARLSRELVPMLDVHKTIIEIIHDSIAVYVRWSEQHPSLRWIIDRGAQSPGGPIQRRVTDIAQVVTNLVFVAFDGYGMDFPGREREYVDPLVHGLVEAVVGIVRRWVSLEDPPPADMLVHLCAESVWYIMAGHAQALGVTLQRDQRLSDIDLDD